MTQILIASGNPHKHDEIARLLESSGLTGVTFVRPADLTRPTPPPDPVEDGSTYLENARIKATAFSVWAGGMPALADDSGLEVDALGGAPGLKSARYAGENVSFSANIDKLLGALDGRPEPERSGRFVCALSLARGSDVILETEGTCSGTVLTAITGSDGFGYDPIFRPDGESRSFAEMSMAEKDLRSHRGHAFASFVERWCQGNVAESCAAATGSGGSPLR